MSKKMFVVLTVASLTVCFAISAYAEEKPVPVVDAPVAVEGKTVPCPCAAVRPVIHHRVFAPVACACEQPQFTPIAAFRKTLLHGFVPVSCVFTATPEPEVVGPAVCGVAPCGNFKPFLPIAAHKLTRHGAFRPLSNIWIIGDCK